MSLPMNSLYSLTWGDYGTSLVSAIQLLRCHGDLVDCTLAAGGRSFPAHKIVLCAASPFLLDLLKNTPCKHPVVMLAGVNANDLEALLEFVYRGEVSVDHAQLPSLLQAAQCLNIQGLAPQTVTKDDYTTHSIQLQHMIPQHHDQDQLIATIATAPQQTVHAQVVEDIHHQGQILQATTQTNAAGQQQTIVTTDAAKHDQAVIQAFLPARKRKPRMNKKSPTAPKISKVEGMDTIMGTPTSSHGSGSVQQVLGENGAEGQLLSSTPIIKSEGQKVETIVTMDPNNMIPVTSANAATGEITTAQGATGSSGVNTSGGSSTPKAKRAKHPPGAEKPRSRSQSEQPATCPICYAVIRQSRNLRRHLELRHFAKPGVKKEKKSKSGNDTTLDSSLELNTTAEGDNTVGSDGPGGAGSAGGQSSATSGKKSSSGSSASGSGGALSSSGSVPQVQTVQSLHTLQGVQVKKDPDAQQQQQQQQQQAMAVSGSAGGQVQQQQVQQVQQQVQQQQQQLQHHQIIDSSGNITTATTSAQAAAAAQQQAASQQQQLVAQSADGSESGAPLSIAQVQTLQGHQIIGNLNQGNNKNILVKKVFILKGGNNT
ncbi:transcription factor GAGA isoform X2 [Drosophila subpulchrella]|uniref:transcription factor GAGA isoform X2 n=1 Tax=Drosophila subpulchrella TaxID=1486046 RepID=UPI0018A16DAF|nr:transcription factor GAGA isoform X2 [Drosophila subpulchrella]